jgi:hypothetical protein
MSRNRAIAACLLLQAGLSVRASAGGDLPGAAFDFSRYHALWEKSPFAVATPVAAESSEYSLVGAAQFDGVSYASIIDKQNSDHFVVTSATPAHGFTLVDLVRGQNADSTFATLENNGGVLKLKLETAAVTANSSSSPASGAPAAQAAPVFSPPAFLQGIHRRPPRVRMINPPIFVPRPPPN